MIKMVKAKELMPGMIISTDGLRIEFVRDHTGLLGKFEVYGKCHGTTKSAMFHPDDELPIWYDDSNDGED